MAWHLLNGDPNPFLTVLVLIIAAVFVIGTVDALAARNRRRRQRRNRSRSSERPSVRRVA